jgi:nucleotide-binding universal stress UspA family protein
MKIKPTVKPGQVSVELEAGDERLLEKAAAASRPPSAFKLERVLVPIDFSIPSIQALDYAAALAQQFSATLILLHVVEPAVYPDNYLGVSAVLDEANQGLLQRATERLGALGRKRIGNRVSTDFLVRMGRAYSEIPDTAKALGADWIIIGTHGHGGWKQALLGSTTERVVRHAHCPVLILPHLGGGAPA